MSCRLLFQMHCSKFHPLRALPFTVLPGGISISCRSICKSGYCWLAAQYGTPSTLVLTMKRCNLPLQKPTISVDLWKSISMTAFPTISLCPQRTAIVELLKMPVTLSPVPSLLPWVKGDALNPQRGVKCWIIQSHKSILTFHFLKSSDTVLNTVPQKVWHLHLTYGRHHNIQSGNHHHPSRNHPRRVLEPVAHVFDRTLNPNSQVNIKDSSFHHISLLPQPNNLQMNFHLVYSYSHWYILAVWYHDFFTMWPTSSQAKCSNSKRVIIPLLCDLFPPKAGTVFPCQGWDLTLVIGLEAEMWQDSVLRINAILQGICFRWGRYMVSR